MGMGLRLRQLREQKGLSVRALAEKAGVDFSAINRIELGKSTPKLSTLEKLAKTLGVSIRDLIDNGGR
jgi:transcriptional regulator with XRE-family HTH domain